ncbi:MAG: 1-(5-phosphoribosyl)-5-[(5-phosphoribosylamino)methylideneamino]imidazole-4-carboxamide isomerase [Clostridiales bacterium]|jgi:phosphoribosylformimino-5-aminoimidazole carboxamide ribotide isomerase|nr:1-(5-phosphoribosyl)-5-[(5-phosphoribosylamino)methylideneamino]imidazole-4-carboxamide isomerase [Clostridiales bacterium]
MTILPSIDLKESKCVRLYKGDFATVHEVAGNPLEVALKFKQAGADIVHTVDLDGALNGHRINAHIIRELALKSGLKVEMGGGLRSMKDLEEVNALGVYRMIIGSAAVGDPGFVEEAVRKYGNRIAVGVDARDGRVSTHGWTVDSEEDALTFALKMERLGVKTIIFTDIDTDGMLTGPPLESLTELRAALNCDIIASGGVSGLEDIAALKRIGMNGVIIGKAFYTGAVDLEKAVKLGGE